MYAVWHINALFLVEDNNATRPHTHTHTHWGDLGQPVVDHGFNSAND